jgi:hypothetical protein
MNLDLKKIGAIIVVIAIAAYFAYPMLVGQNNGIDTSTQQGDSSTGATARPFVDYKTADGRVLRVYLDDDSKYWVNPDGTLTPYTPGTWTVPGTLSQITQVQFGFSLTVNGKYLKDTNGDGYQDITVFVTANVKNNSTGTYSVFSNQRYDYQAGQPSSGGSASDTIQSGFLSIDTLFSNIWGGSPVQDTEYWPYYDVTISVNATSVWGEPLSTSASATYDKNSIGSWQWKQAELTASLGSASSTTQSWLDIATAQGQVTLLTMVGIAIAAILLVARRWD